ncbi:glycosyltransferase [Pseudomonas sp. 21LCFQ02]|uniref:glycosyltransferase n=1 Tax=unclassified Pseudomonas TaxID=196821 RepID=UPI0004F8708C|nr:MULTISPECIES: glycosyltransferase [unclassified Pseudomonas]MCO8168703.1 glycosyltransferase [Pseudomonas sp. 21LCFQ02]MCQ9423088.1 glycosyltransferase [Pseudomonas sp. LJDD11]BAP45064.1 glycosyl transferase, group 2 family protein [Pseudomonas sp. StFLB209]
MIGVLIPVHNEEQHLDQCLATIQQAARHPGLEHEPVSIIVVLDSCTDGSAQIARDRGVMILELQARNVGQARAAGARQLIGLGSRWLACTDGDSNVAEDWLYQQLALQADAVCGTVTLGQWSEGYCEAARIEYHRRYQHREGHRHVHGANLGVSAQAYQRAGGFPALACHEDVHLVRELELSGARIAWSCRPRVTTSARLDPRAQGGFGDYLRSLETSA